MGKSRVLSKNGELYGQGLGSSFWTRAYHERKRKLIMSRPYGRGLGEIALKECLALKEELGRNAATRF